VVVLSIVVATMLSVSAYARRTRSVVVVLSAVLAFAVPWLRAATAGAVDSVTYTYSIAVKGTVRSDVNEFASHAAATLSDPADGRWVAVSASYEWIPVATSRCGLPKPA
jgi:hypothetical protein